MSTCELPHEAGSGAAAAVAAAAKQAPASDLPQPSSDAAVAAPATQEKKIRRRAFAPKSRNGCITCKIRRKKCDEEKPFCRRCIKAQVVCDGYAPNPKAARSAKQAIQPSTASIHAVRHPHALAIPYRGRGSSHSDSSSGLDSNSPTQALVRNPVGGKMPLYGITLMDSSLDPAFLTSHPSSRVFFHHFRTNVIPDLIRFVDAGDFWIAHVLPLCYTEPAVLHAITALGAAHTSFVSSPTSIGGSATHDAVSRKLSQMQSDHEQIVAQHYNHAIHQILTRFDANNMNDVNRLSMLLVCCITFYCLECLQGRPFEALKHLQSGASLLCTLENSRYRLIGPDNYDTQSFPPLLRGAATALDRLGIDASLLQCDPVIPNVSPFTMPVEPDYMSSTPFNSMQEAKDAIWDLDSRMFRLGPPGPEDDCACCEGDDPSHCDMEAICNDPQWKVLQRDFRCWTAKFGASFGRVIMPDEPPSVALRERLLLTVRQRIWDIFSTMNEKHLPIIYEATICTIEHVYEVEAALGQSPVFTLDCDTIPLLVMIASDSETNVPRILRLLRQYRRRECLWDSFIVADKMEASLPNIPKDMDWEIGYWF